MEYVARRFSVISLSKHISRFSRPIHKRAPINTQSRFDPRGRAFLSFDSLPQQNAQTNPSDIISLPPLLRPNALYARQCPPVIPVFEISLYTIGLKLGTEFNMGEREESNSPNDLVPCSFSLFLPSTLWPHSFQQLRAIRGIHSFVRSSAHSFKSRIRYWTQLEPSVCFNGGAAHISAKSEPIKVGRHSGILETKPTEENSRAFRWKYA